MYLLLSSATLVNTVIADNRAPTAGSGVYAAGSSPQIVHATIARNSGPGGGVYADVSPWGDVYSTVAVTNTIIAGHTVGVTVTQGSTAILNATLWHANGADRSGAGTINHNNDRSGDPAFKADGYHLTSRSAAIDAGVAAGMRTDIDGDMRPQGAGYDIGADEYPTWSIYVPLVVKRR